jgi:hypothetical protein
MDMGSVLVGVAWFAIGAVLVAGIVDSFRKVRSSTAPLPLFREMERRGLTRPRAEDTAGMTQFAGAVRRCLFCSARPQCEHGDAPLDCPNEDILRRAADREDSP